MMGRKQGKMPRGICSVCRKDSALRADGTVFRHPDTYRHTEVCRGSTEKPSHVWDEKLETFIRWDIYAQGAEARKQAEAEDTAAAIGIGEGPMLLGCEYPVLNEHGRVVGRARIEVGHIRILGVKWMEKAS